jgi:hypothetical protein
MLTLKRAKLIREYAKCVAEGFLNDLVIAEEINQGPVVARREQAMIDAFRNYVHDPYTLFHRHRLSLDKNSGKK